MGTIILVYIITGIISCIGMGLIFKKINLGFTKGIIPFYNKIILINKYTLPPYHFILVFIPIISIYTNYCIYKRLCEEYKKDSFYVIQLAFFPFVYNFFLGMELEQEKKPVEPVEEKVNEKTEEKQDEFFWKPREILKSGTVYKASRNNFGRINVKMTENNGIIEDKKITKKQKNNKKQCQNCGAKVNETAKVCPVCGTKI